MSSAEYYRKYYEEHKEEIQKYQKKYNEENKEEIQKYRAENKERIQENKRRHSEKNPEYQRNWWEKNPEKRKEYYQKQAHGKNRILHYLIEKYEGTPCMDCDGVFNWCAMDFDHRPGEVKVSTIAHFGWYKAAPKSIARVEKEIAKCDLICSNCHRVRTQDRYAKPQG